MKVLGHEVRKTYKKIELKSAQKTNLTTDLTKLSYQCGVFIRVVARFRITGQVNKVALKIFFERQEVFISRGLKECRVKSFAFRLFN